ncbi:hypothetical protein RB195_024343 [Necator americanus]|uniref:SWIM-type domain-containing protein n=1 Tax=Necator americanus TaxID=51031 RepID=A0ABR1EMS5_NECAM
MMRPVFAQVDQTVTVVRCALRWIIPFSQHIGLLCETHLRICVDSDNDHLQACWSWNLGSERQWECTLRGGAVLSIRREGKRGVWWCPYAFACTCSIDGKSWIKCVHVHVALLYAAAGRHSQQDALSSVVSRETESVRDGPYSSDGDEEVMEMVVEDDVENEEEVEEARQI